MLVFKDEFTKKVLEVIAQYEPTEEDLSASDGEKENGHMETNDEVKVEKEDNTISKGTLM